MGTIETRSTDRGGFFLCACVRRHTPHFSSISRRQQQPKERERESICIWQRRLLLLPRTKRRRRRRNERQLWTQKETVFDPLSLFSSFYLFIFFCAPSLFFVLASSFAWRFIEKRTEKIRHYKARKWRPLSIDIVHFIYLFHHSFRILFIYIYITLVLYNLIYS